MAAMPEPSGRWDSVWAGTGLGVLGHLVLLQIVRLAPGGSRSEIITTAFGALLVIGVSQLVYMLPMWAIALRLGKRRMARGLVLVAALTLLLNVGCWGIVTSL
jgi:hypothetical protein